MAHGRTKNPLSDRTIVLPRATRPGSFTALMTLYESNFVRLGALLDGPLAEGDRYVSAPVGDHPLHLTVEEVCRYTTTLHMTYYFDAPAGPVADPDVTVRLYHDARLVEAMGCAALRRHKAVKHLDIRTGSQLNRRWARNVMLNKWLEYCADLGHRFRRQPRICDPVVADTCDG